MDLKQTLTAFIRKCRRTARVWLILLLFLPGLPVAAPPTPSAEQAQTTLADLSLPAQFAISEALGRDQTGYHLTPTAAGFRAEHPDQALAADFDAAGLDLRAGGEHWRLTLAAYGYGDRLSAVEPAQPQAEANHLEYQRGPLTEWYRHGPLGLQQGFTLAERPATNAAEADEAPLTLALNLSSAGAASVAEDGRSLRLGTLTYSGLLAYDATGQELLAWLELRDDRLLVRVDDREAAYPVLIDPWIQQAKLTPSDTPRSHTGYSVAASDDAVVVGAPYDDQNGAASGAIYIFYTQEDDWSSVHSEKLVASDGAAGDLFGYTVAISDHTVVVGAPFKNDRGAAYVFTHTSNWWHIAEVAKLTASDSADDGRFGNAVAISGDTVVIGAPFDDDDHGATYIYIKPSGGWADANAGTAKLTASDGWAMDTLGFAVAADGDVVIAGAPGDNDAGTASGSGYVFVKPNDGWTDAIETAKLTASDGAGYDEFGCAVSIKGETIVIGAPYDDEAKGAAYVFIKPSGSWANAVETAKLTSYNSSAGDEFGHAVSISNDTVVVGAPEHNDLGAAYVFAKPDSASWVDTHHHTAKLIASEGVEGDRFGWAVGISNGTLVAGAQPPDGWGLAYLFSKPNGEWSDAVETARLLQNGNAFGGAVTASGDTIVVGMPFDNNQGSSSGSAYIFVKPSGGWSSATETAKLTASDGEAGDYFGYSVAISGDTIVIGAYGDDDNGSESGSAYVFTKPAEGWTTITETAKLTDAAGAKDNGFGYDVDIDGNTIVVGAYGNSDHGAAYIFSKPDEGWTTTNIYTAKLVAIDIADNSKFGLSVAISDDTIVVGAPFDRDDIDITPPGSVYVFVKPNGDWVSAGETAKLTTSNRDEITEVGYAVDIHDDTIVAGTWWRGGGDGRGSAYVFAKPDEGWTSAIETAILTASDGVPENYFGSAVAINGNVIVIGAYWDHDQYYAPGAAYVFARPDDGWGTSTETVKLTAANPITKRAEHFGYAVVVEDGVIAVGKYRADEDRCYSVGAVYVFNYQALPRTIYLPIVIR